MFAEQCLDRSEGGNAKGLALASEQSNAPGRKGDLERGSEAGRSRKRHLRFTEALAAEMRDRDELKGGLKGRGCTVASIRVQNAIAFS